MGKRKDIWEGSTGGGLTDTIGRDYHGHCNWRRGIRRDVYAGIIRTRSAAFPLDARFARNPPGDTILALAYCVHHVAAKLTLVACLAGCTDPWHEGPLSIKATGRQRVHQCIAFRVGHGHFFRCTVIQLISTTGWHTCLRHGNCSGCAWHGWVSGVRRIVRTSRWFRGRHHCCQSLRL